MPLERLERLFSEIGEAAEKLAAIRAQLGGGMVIGGPVAHSEAVRSVADIYAQTNKAASVPLTEATARAEALSRAKLDSVTERLTKAISQSLAQAEGRAKGSAPPEKPKSGLLESVKRLPPVSWVEAGLKVAEYVEKQEAAGKAVDGFTRAVGVAARFLYSMVTGNVILRSGRRVPWRRALAVAMRGSPANRGLRRALLYPDIALRRVRRTLASAQTSPRPGPTAARQAAESANAASALKVAAQATPQFRAPDAALGTTAAQALARGAGAGARAGVVQGAATTAVGTAGRAALALASPIGLAVGAIIALTAAIVAAVVGLRKFTVSVAESTKALLARRFEQYAQFNPAIGAAQARMEASAIGTRIRIAEGTSATTVQLTNALLQLGKEMEPINRALINAQNIAAILLIQVARGVNALIKLTAIVPLIEWITRFLGQKNQQKAPVEEFLRALEGLGGNHPRNPPPKGGFPPWQ